MSRSNYIWIVTEGVPSQRRLPVAVFTAKHEAASWLFRRADKDFAVWRYRDAASSDAPPVRLNRSTLEPLDY